MKNTILACLLFFSLTNIGFSQQSSTVFDLKNIQVKWELIQNNYEQKNLCLSSFTITNNGKEAFPASGWKLYFNYIRDIIPSGTTGHVKIEHVNGDIFRLYSDGSFAGIGPKGSAKIEFVSSDPTLNISDAPDGLYLVWDAQPEKGISISYKINPIKDSMIGLVTPANIYDRNKNIADIPADKLSKIFPTPAEYKELPGAFELNPLTRISDGGFKQEAKYLSGELAKLFGKELSIANDLAAGKNIVFKKTELPQDAYHLIIAEDAITIEASSATGIFYGVQSLKSLLPVSAWSSQQNTIQVTCVDVKDHPRFGFRSFMLDVGRNFQEKKEILKVLDLMALYKLNAFHFHFTDDEGWRIEIPGLPELTTIGSRRGHTLDSKKLLPASFADGPDPDHSFGTGYYSRKDFIEILQYANFRHIQVIPEFESPGHARAAIKAMDARYEKFMQQGNKEEAEKYLLRDPDDQSKYSTAQLWTDNVICVAQPSVYRFMDKVIDEIVMMYKEAGAPLTTIHLGGDEVPAGVWEHSPVCNELIKKDSSVKTTDDLWYYYYGKLNKMLQNRGLILSGWEEVGLRKTYLDWQKQMIPNPRMANENIRLHVWNNMIGWGAEDLPYRLANAGYKVILSCVSNQYFDLAYIKSAEEPGYYWGGFTDVDKSFYFIPYDYYKNSKEDRRGNPIAASYFNGKDRLTEFGKSNIVGIQGLLWSENIKGPDRLEYMLLPKILGLAERAWAPDPSWATEKDPGKMQALYNDAWSLFINTISKRELPRLDYYDGGFNYRIPTTGVIAEDGKLKANVQFAGYIIRYTTDGKEPDLKSKIYSAPISEKTTVKFKVFDSRGRSGRTVVIENK